MKLLTTRKSRLAAMANERATLKGWRLISTRTIEPPFVGSILPQRYGRKEFRPADTELILNLFRRTTPSNPPLLAHRRLIQLGLGETCSESTLAASSTDKRVCMLK